MTIEEVKVLVFMTSVTIILNCIFGNLSYCGDMRWGEKQGPSIFFASNEFEMIIVYADIRLWWSLPVWCGKARMEVNFEPQ